MLHLFNSCYVYPDILYDPSNNHLMVGQKHLTYSMARESFYYINTVPKDAFDRVESFESFSSSNWLEPLVNNKDRFVIYTDDENYIKFFTAKLKTQVKNLNKEFFLTCAKLFAVKIRTRAKLLNTDDSILALNLLANKFAELEDIPDVQAFNLSDKWVKNNAGVEWRFANGDHTVFNDLIERNIYSYFGEARAKYLSRKEPEGSWALDPNNQKYNTVVSIKDLYMEMRKDISIFTDALIVKYLNSENIFDDPKFLLLLSSNKDMGDKVDIWLVRWFIKMTQEEIDELGILA